MEDYGKMDLELFDSLLKPPIRQDIVPLSELLIRIIVATILGFMISGVTYLTYTGKNFDRSVIHSQIIVTIVFSIMINVIGHNLAWAIGIFGALSFIQFRTTLKDAKDTATFFYAVVTGVACGAGFINLAIFSFIIMSVVQVILKFLPGGIIHYTYIKFNCKSIDARDSIKNFLKSQKVFFELSGISMKSNNLVFIVKLSMEEAFSLAQKTHSHLPDLIDGFSLDTEP